MNIPNYENAQFVEKTGYLTDYWQLILQSLISTLQAGVGQEGFQISIVSSAANSVTPPAAGGQVAALQAAAAAGAANAPVKGTIIFDPAEVNGGSGPAPNGQLKVLLADNVFHKITNT